MGSPIDIYIYGIDSCTLAPLALFSPFPSSSKILSIASLLTSRFMATDQSAAKYKIACVNKTYIRLYFGQS